MTHADEVIRPIGGNRLNTLNARMGTGGNQIPILHTRIGSLCYSDYKGVGNQLVQAGKVIPTSNSVRKLTPLECERAMGLPDNYTDIPFKGKPAPDSRRYKAIGNGMAVPCSDWILGRIAKYMR